MWSNNDTRRLSRISVLPLSIVQKVRIPQAPLKEMPFLYKWHECIMDKMNIHFVCKTLKSTLSRTTQDKLELRFPTHISAPMIQGV